MATELRGGDMLINGHTVWHTGNVWPKNIGHIDHLWNGYHWMDGGSWLNIGHDFNNYQAICIHVCSNEGGMTGGHMINEQIWCPTAVYGWSNYMFVDLTGSDWAAAYLADNWNIVPSAGSNCYIADVFGLR